MSILGELKYSSKKKGNYVAKIPSTCRLPARTIGARREGEHRENGRTGRTFPGRAGERSLPEIGKLNRKANRFIDGSRKMY